MANDLPSDEALDAKYTGQDAEITIDHGTHRTTYYGTIDKVVVDGEGGVGLELSCFVPVADIPDLPAPGAKP